MKKIAAVMGKYSGVATDSSANWTLLLKELKLLA